MKKRTMITMKTIVYITVTISVFNIIIRPFHTYFHFQDMKIIFLDFVQPNRFPKWTALPPSSHTLHVLDLQANLHS